MYVCGSARRSRFICRVVILNEQLARSLTGAACLLTARAFSLSTADPRRARPELAAALAEERWAQLSNPTLGHPHRPAISEPAPPGAAAAERAARLAQLSRPRTALWELCE